MIQDLMDLTPATSLVPLSSDIQHRGSLSDQSNLTCFIMPIPFSVIIQGMHKMCAECEGHLCACRPVINHHSSETRFVFPQSLRQLKVGLRIKLFLWERGLSNARLYGFVLAVCHSAPYGNITGHTHSL